MISFVTHNVRVRMTGYLVSIGKNPAFNILLLHPIILYLSMVGCKQINLLLLEIPFPFFSSLCSSAKLSSCALLMNQSSASLTSDGRSSPTIFSSTDLLTFVMNRITQPQIIISFFHDEWLFGFTLHNDGVSNCMAFATMTTWMTFSSWTSEYLSMSVFTKASLSFLKFSGPYHHKSLNAKSSIGISRDSKSAGYCFVLTWFYLSVAGNLWFSLILLATNGLNFLLWFITHHKTFILSIQ